MPLYQVEHSCPLSQDQQEGLAKEITTIHSEKFTTPSLFVNVTFKDISSQPTYVAGKRVCVLLFLYLGPIPTCFSEHSKAVAVTCFYKEAIQFANILRLYL